MALKIRTVFLYASISIIFFITIHHLILSPSSNNLHSFNHHLFIPHLDNNLIQNDAVSDNKIAVQFEPIIQTDQGTVLSNTSINELTSSTTHFDADDVTSSITPQYDDVKSPLVHANSSIVTHFDNDDVTSSQLDDHGDINSPLITTEFDNDDVTSSISTTKFYEHDVNITEIDNDDVKSPLSHVNFTGIDYDDVNSPLSTQVIRDQVESLNSTGLDTDDVTSSISTTTSNFYDVKSPLTGGFDNDDEVNSSIRTRFQDYDVNSPIIRQFDLNSSISTQLNEVNNASVSTHFSNDDVMISNVNVSVLFPAWEALVIVKSDDIEENNKSRSFYCLFDTNEVTKAKFAGTLSFSRETYTCRLPTRFRRRLPFQQPVLTYSKDDVWVTSASPPELLRWNYIVYDVIDNEKDENDVVLLAKGINNRQGVNRSPKEFRCLFGDDLVKGVLTEVSSSIQEVFRCKRPDLSHLTAFSQSVVKASLVIVESNHVVPSIAYYEPRHSKLVKEGGNGKKLLCACTMVYNVAKFLKEWVIYHANIGVDKFVLYDNGSDDDLDEVVKVLQSRGYDVEVRFWLWPKTQEAGYSHAVFVDKDSCKWMMYIDVDEFVYSPKWKSLKPSKGLLPALLPSSPYGQVMIKCYEFGPSGQKKHPLTGVTQGYNCRKEVENRHKSIVLLDAVHESLLNMIHHFKLKDGYTSMKVELESMAVNHYKYQAWVEFKAKFRRRVSAYVVDWTRSVNLKSNDRAPGLGYSAVMPDGWEDRFCEVHDNRLRDLTRRWFGRRNGRSGVRIRMAWAK